MSYWTCSRIPTGKKESNSDVSTHVETVVLMARKDKYVPGCDLGLDDKEELVQSKL